MQSAAHEPLFDIAPQPAPASRSSLPIGRWKRSAGAALVGFGKRAGGTAHRVVRRLGNSLRATQPIAMRCRASAPPTILNSVMK